jgi:hypothetical protein
MEMRMPTQNSYELLATGFHMEMRRIDMKYWPLDSVWRQECPLKIYAISGTGSSMEIRMPTKNVYEILGTVIRH